MCQLLGMNCNAPTDICFSFEGFRTRGGQTDVHKDGWGIAFFEGPGCRVFLDVEPSAQSAVAHLKDQDVSVDFSAVTNPDDRVAVIATLPLTDNENWIAMEPGMLMAFHDGVPAATVRTA